MEKLVRYGRVYGAWRIKKTPTPGYVPEDISIELTNTCNFRCNYCPQSDPAHAELVPRTTLSPDQAESMFQNLRDSGVKTDVMHWTLDGEPFINRQIDEICKRAIDYGWRHFIFATNGFFCSLERVRALPRQPKDVSYRLCIDYCSDEQLFETERGTRTSWKMVGDNIRSILSNPEFAHIYVKVTDISSFTVHDPKDLQKRADDLSSLFPNQDRLKLVSRIFHNVTGYLDDILENKKAGAADYNLCPYPWTSMVIASNGDVVACCRDLRHKTVLGNLFEQNARDIWRGEKYQRLRQSLVDQDLDSIGACSGCDLPYDDGKFKLSHILHTAINRLGI